MRRPLDVTATPPHASGWRTLEPPACARACAPAAARGMSMPWIHRGCTHPCNSSISAKVFPPTPTQTRQPSVVVARCLSGPGKRGTNRTALVLSWAPRMQSTPSSPPLSTVGPHCANERTGVECQCHLAGTCRACSLSSTPHHVQTTPPSSPVTTNCLCASIASAVTTHRCVHLRLACQPSPQMWRSFPSPSATAPSTASKGPAAPALTGTVPPCLGAVRSSTAMRSTWARWPSRPRRTRTSSRLGQRIARMGSVRTRAPRHAQLLESHNRSSPSVEPVAIGSNLSGRSWPEQMAVTWPSWGGSAPIWRRVRTL